MYRTHEPCLRKPVFAYMYVKTKDAEHPYRQISTFAVDRIATAQNGCQTKIKAFDRAISSDYIDCYLVNCRYIQPVHCTCVFACTVINGLCRQQHRY